MVERRRHARKLRTGSFVARERAAKLPPMYRGARGRSALRDIYTAEPSEPHVEGRFRWLMSTCVAAAVGAIAIIVVVVGSSDQARSPEGLMPTLQRIRDTAVAPAVETMIQRTKGLKWALPRTDRLAIGTGALSTRFIIHETLRQKRGGREYIFAKPYVRIVARLAPVPPNYADVIPPFNPFTLYANRKPIGAAEEGAVQTNERRDVLIKVVELLGGILPAEDGQEIETAEADELVARTIEIASAGPAAAPALDPVEQPLGKSDADEAGPNTTVMRKLTGDGEAGPDDLEGLKRVVKKVAEGEKLSRILGDAGADPYLVREMLEAMKSVFPERQLAAGYQVQIVLAPSLTQQNKLEPIRYTIVDASEAHKVTVARSNAGEFVASATPMDDDALMRIAMSESGQSQPSSLYAALYHSMLVQHVPTETINQVLRIHAYETDFRRRLRNGDTCEFFFDLKDEGGTDGPPGELLFTAISAGTDTARYYRFRTPDGAVDYYDAQGNNSKKFLMRRPVRADDVRLTSGFGVRFHPLLNERRMHTGVDWSTTPGTPILAAGNGTIEEAGRKGQYGNYIRIRHANGYQSAYGHMQRIAEGAAPGVKVRQGQVIGYVGSTGLSSGPHLHYEVLVNNQFVDPLSIQVPRERQLEGRDLQEFQKERARIDELMRRSPVMKATK